MGRPVNDAYICAALRTPVGKHGGALASVRADDLAAIPIKAVVERSGIDPATIDDVILGCTNQAGEDNRNVARMALLLAGLPVEVPGQTVNRLCGSGLQAAASAAQAVKAGEGDVFVAGGVENMTRAPYVMLKSGDAWSRKPPEIADTTVGWRFTNPRLKQEWTISLGATAEVVAERYHIGRAEQDAFAVESQRRAERALRECVFTEELVPVSLPDGSTFAKDEYPRAGTTLEAVAKLKPAFQQDGTVTAATSSGINDGAAALLLTGKDGGGPGRLTPLARVVATAVAGVDPSCMGLGPIPATQKVLRRAGLTIDQIDLVELNEAFAAQAIACIRELQLDATRVNIYGGAIALGHPLGATGARILTTLVHALHRTKSRYGLATMCIGVGQGIALIVERC
ncbi:MAG: beta-ketoadipyl CoA thiolase [Gemmatimonadetes bacterium 13_1_40CM_4_69_8]|nr:MAG: beta-ketoadipyl CoA thiolase [Gemmatimonadetes bacterium 13_1_40CM_69_22]OLC75813.1 MAG: beta-ketoadipyl CoA thiolase [Gemmatimonadetes bacterium 13_1_40CM_4_69_8]